MIAPSLRGRETRIAITLSAAVAIVGSALAQQSTESAPGTPRIFEVQRGDTFSGIAARVTGNIATWRKLYDPQRTGIVDPSLIFPGMRLELIRLADGSSYLSLISGTGAVRATTQPIVGTPAATAPSVTTAASAGKAPERKAAAEVQATSTGPMTIGIIPNIGAVALLGQYEHLKRYLERVTGRPIQIATASNFKTFFDGTMQGDYDLAVTASHFARVAEVDRGLVPIAIFEPAIRALLVTSVDHPIESVQALRGRSIAFANPQSLVAMYGYKWLASQNLQVERDYQIKATRTDVGIGPLLLGGEAAAAVMSNGEFRQIPEDQRQRLKVINEFAQIPNFVVLAHPRLGVGTVDRLRTQFKSFGVDGQEGAAFRAATGVASVQAVSDTQMRELDAFATETRRVMGVAK